MSDEPTTEQWLNSANLSPDDLEGGSDSPMTDRQAHILKALCWQLGEKFDKELTAEAAERRIAQLRERV